MTVVLYRMLTNKLRSAEDVPLAINVSPHGNVGERESGMLPQPLSSFGTPEVRFLYQRYGSVYSVHRKNFCRTFSVL